MILSKTMNVLIVFDIILAGDFNINFLEAGATVSHELDLTRSFGQYNCVNEVTQPKTLTITIKLADMLLNMFLYHTNLFLFLFVEPSLY